MAITRTAMVDDDGSGTTGTILNNAWKTELYNQIDGMSAGLAWTPTDVSGANLVFTVAEGAYCVTGAMVTFWGRVQYPTTSSGLNANLGGLPLVNGNYFAGAYMTLGLPALLHLAKSAGNILVLQTNTAPYTNALLTGAQLIFQGFYLKA
jgi:hypothetical protein